jgi:hypothetical protein
MLIDGATIWKSPLAPISPLTANTASFSQAIRTSPIPRSTKVTVEPRAPVSRIGTFLKIRPTKSLVLAGSLLNLRRP